MFLEHISGSPDLFQDGRSIGFPAVGLGLKVVMGEMNVDGVE